MLNNTEQMIQVVSIDAIDAYDKHSYYYYMSTLNIFCILFKTKNIYMEK